MSFHRLSRFLAQLDSQAGEGCLISKTTDIRWLTGFTGSSAALLVLPEEMHFFTDGRYTDQAASETNLYLDAGSGASEPLHIHIKSGDPILHAGLYAKERGAQRVRLQLDHLSYKHVEDLQKSVRTESLDVEIQRLRSEKDESEVALIRRALYITEQTFIAIQPLVKAGVTERELAAEIDYHQRKMGADKNSFETIVAFGANAALPHARPGDTVLHSGMPILLDFGAVVGGYASDMTRMIHFGTPSSDFISVYNQVEQSLLASQNVAKSGMTGQGLDNVARESLKGAGLDGYFSHSLGHGVGLDIHEWPAVSSRNSEPLPAKAVVTLEPGAYILAQFGVRIENMVQLETNGCSVLNTLSTQLVVL